LADPWRLQVRSPEQVLLDVSEVSRVQIQLVDGPITILQGHIPLIGETVASALRYRTTDGTERRLYLQPGILIVDGNSITILTSGAVSGDGRQTASAT
jgi:F0F1-type ATP synthase epsilon subunit